MDMVSAFKKAADKNPKLANKISQVEELRKIERKEKEKELKEIGKERHVIDKLILRGHKTIDILNDPTQMGGIKFVNNRDSLIFSKIFGEIVREQNKDLKGHYKDCKCFCCNKLGTRRFATPHALSELQEELGFSFLIDDKESTNFFDKLKEKVGIMVDEFTVGDETKYICSPCRVKMINDLENEINQLKNDLVILGKREDSLKKDLKKL